MNKYFTTEESGEFSFYQLPKALFTSERYADTSTDAKILYALLIDRMHLSAKNGFADESEHVYVFLSVNQACELLHCGRGKILHLFRELENVDLIERKRRGQGKASVIYPKKFVSDVSKQDFKKFEKRTSKGTENELQEVPKSVVNNTEYNKTDFSNNNLSVCGCDRDEIEEEIKEQIDYDILTERVPKEPLDEIVMLITDTVRSDRQKIKICGQKFSREAVRSRFSKLRCEHIEYVLESLSKTQTKINNMYSYLLTALYNAPVTMELYYQAEVNHDFAGGLSDD